jgi:hypothetical protein
MIDLSIIEACAGMTQEQLEKIQQLCKHWNSWKLDGIGKDFSCGDGWIVIVIKGYTIGISPTGESHS